MRPIGPILLRGRLAVEVLSGGNHCCAGLVPSVSAAVTAGLLAMVGVALIKAPRDSQRSCAMSGSSRKAAVCWLSQAGCEVV
jgi:hypothetical protein